MNTLKVRKNQRAIQARKIAPFSTATLLTQPTTEELPYGFHEVIPSESASNSVATFPTPQIITSTVHYQYDEPTQMIFKNDTPMPAFIQRGDIVAFSHRENEADPVVLCLDNEEPPAEKKRKTRASTALASQKSQSEASNTRRRKTPSRERENPLVENPSANIEKIPDSDKATERETTFHRPLEKRDSEHTVTHKFTFQTPSNVPSEHKQRLQSLLSQFSHLFATSEYNVGLAPNFEVKLELIDGARPVRIKPYPTSPWQRDEMKKHVEQLLKADIIEPARDTDQGWCFPALNVKKSGSSFTNPQTRMVVDYRRLGPLLKLPGVSQPRVEMTAQQFGGKKIFSRFDCRAAFYSLKIRKEDRPKTTFATPQGSFSFKRCPMRLSVSPLKWSEFVTQNLSDIPNCIFYQDDLAIATDTYEEHLCSLEALFIRLERMNIRLHPKKCDLLQPSITFLGWIFSDKGRKISPEKVEALLKMPPPTSKKLLRSFIGLAAYLSSTVPNAAHFLAPFHEKLRKDRPFKWSTQDQNNFEKLKEHFGNPILLGNPSLDVITPENPLLLRTDGSERGIGAVLSYIDPDLGERPLYFFSRKLTDAQAKWHSYELEVFAVMSAIRSLDHFLSYYPFRILTDSKNMVTLLTKRHESKKIQRWARFIGSYQNGEVVPFIEHINGKDNISDIFSRLPIAKTITEDPAMAESITITRKTVERLMPGTPPSSSDVEITVAPIQNATKDPIGPSIPITEERVRWPTSVEELVHLQRADKEISPIIHCLEYPQKVNLPAPGRAENMEFSFGDSGELYAMHNDYNKGLVLQCLVIPDVMQPTILQAYHDNFGHQGLQKTLSRIRADVWFPRMYSKVKQYLSNCPVCAKFNICPSPSHKGQLRSTDEPMTDLSMDIVSMPTTKQGNQKILTIVCNFSHFIALYPIPDEKAETIANVFLSNFIPT